MGHIFDQWETESDGYILPTQSHGRLGRDAFYKFSWRTVPQDQATLVAADDTNSSIGPPTCLLCFSSLLLSGITKRKYHTGPFNSIPRNPVGDSPGLSDYKDHTRELSSVASVSASSGRADFLGRWPRPLAP